MTTPATKPTRSKPTAKSTTSTTKKTAAKPAAKTTKTTKTTTKPAAAVVEPTKTTTLDEASAAALVKSFAALNAARESFDDLVEHYLRNGVSPTHIGKPIGLGNSSVRRIAFRRNVEGVK